MDKLERLWEEWRSLQPLSEKKQHLLSKRFTVEYNYNSNHIEGNTLTYGQTELLLFFGKVSGEGNLRDFVEMKASALSVQMLEEELSFDKPLTQNFILQLHRTLLKEDYVVHQALPGGIQTSYTIHAGAYKSRPNSVITRYGDRFEYASPEETPAMMSDLVDWYNEEERRAKLSPIELAALFHYRYIRIHPFEDGNGRIARLMVNYILARHRWPMIEIRTKHKYDYLDALHEADMLVGRMPSLGAKASLSEIKPFLKYFRKTVEQELRYNVGFATELSPDVWWYDGERLAFRTPSTAMLLRLMLSDPGISIESLAEKVGITTTAVKKQLRQMQQRGYLQRRERDGDWLVLASPSV